MQRHHRILSAAAALLVWVVPASAASPDPDGEIAGDAIGVPVVATWLPVEARNQTSGARGPAAVVFGTAQERGRSRQAILRVDCFDGRTTLHVDDTAPLGLGASAVRPSRVAVMVRLDGGRFVSAVWQASADGSGLELSGERAVAFLNGLYGRSELRLVLLRPLSVPFRVHLRRRRGRTGPRRDRRPLPLVGRAGHQRRRSLDEICRRSRGPPAALSGGHAGASPVSSLSRASRLRCQP